jgi:hypothetical protein
MVVQAQQPLRLFKELILRLLALGLIRQLQQLVAQLQTSNHLHLLAHGLNHLALPLCASAFGVLAVAVVLVGLALPMTGIRVLVVVVVQGLV